MYDFFGKEGTENYKGMGGANVYFAVNMKNRPQLSTSSSFAFDFHIGGKCVCFPKNISFISTHHDCIPYY